MDLSKSVCFALEMIRASLPQTPWGSGYAPFISSLRWDVDERFSGDDKRCFTVEFTVPWQAFKLYSYCEASKNDGAWEIGRCAISNSADPLSNAHALHFSCRIDSDLSLKANPVDQKLSSHGLDADLVDLLWQAGIGTLPALLSCTDFQVCHAFQPRDEYVMTHPNPTQYIDRVTFERYRRLLAWLDRCGYSLHGPRPTVFELQMML